MSVTIRLKLPDGWRQSVQLINEAFQKGHIRATSLVTNKAIDKAPRKYGTLKRSIHSEVSTLGARFTGKVIQDTKVAKYGPFIEFGTGVYGPKGSPIEIVPKNKKALFWKGARHPVRKVVSPGMKARPYMRPAFRESIKEIEVVFNDELMKAIRRIGGN